jgi:hypothetical protein
MRGRRRAADHPERETMRYRHEQMIRMREHGRARVAAELRAVELSLWTSLSTAEQHRWRAYSGAVAAIVRAGD